MSDVEVVGGRYRQVANLGAGGMGEVWRCIDEQSWNRQVAVKLLRWDLVGEQDLVTRFEREVQSAVRVRHENVVSVLDHGYAHSTRGSRPYLVMELVADGDLCAYVERHGVGAIAWRARILADIADALHFVHGRGIVHRDVKPENIMVTAAGGAKLTDFGIALARDHAYRLTQSGFGIGTPRYLSPEQVTGEDLGAASDIYSLGVVGYWLLSGRWPFAEDNAAATALARLRNPAPELPDTVPANLRATIMRALEQDPQRRHSSAAEMAAELRRDLTPAAPFRIRNLDVAPTSPQYSRDLAIEVGGWFRKLGHTIGGSGGTKLFKLGDPSWTGAFTANGGPAASSVQPPQPGELTGLWIKVVKHSESGQERSFLIDLADDGKVLERGLFEWDKESWGGKWAAGSANGRPFVALAFGEYEGFLVKTGEGFYKGVEDDDAGRREGLSSSDVMIFRIDGGSHHLPS